MWDRQALNDQGTNPSRTTPVPAPIGHHTSAEGGPLHSPVQGPLAQRFCPCAPQSPHRAEHSQSHVNPWMLVSGFP